MSEDNFKEYDYDEAVAYIMKYIPQEVADKGYDEDDILNIVDAVDDYYDSKGLFNIELDDTDDVDIDVADMISYVKKQLRKDKDNRVAMDDVEAIVLGELAYEETLGGIE